MLVKLNLDFVIFFVIIGLPFSFDSSKSFELLNRVCQYCHIYLFSLFSFGERNYAVSGL